MTEEEKIWAWIEGHRRRRLARALRAQLENARRRGFKKTQVTLGDLEALLS